MVVIIGFFFVSITFFLILKEFFTLYNPTRG